MTIAQRVLQKILTLPEEQQRQVLAYAESLPAAIARTELVDPYGIFARARCDLDLNDFHQARAETWASFPRELPDETN